MKSTINVNRHLSQKNQEYDRKYWDILRRHEAVNFPTRTLFGQYNMEIIANIRNLIDERSYNGR